MIVDRRSQIQSNERTAPFWNSGHAVRSLSAPPPDAGWSAVRSSVTMASFRSTIRPDRSMSGLSSISVGSASYVPRYMAPRPRASDRVRLAACISCC